MSHASVLVVEDNEDVKNIVVVYLKSKGFEVLVAEDGHTGLDMALRLKPDIILLDVLLPKLDGIETLQALRNSVNCKDIPVIMMSAVLQTRDIQAETAHLQVSSFLQKPFQITQLVTQIQDALDAHNRQPSSHPPHAYSTRFRTRAVTFAAGPPTVDAENTDRKIVCKHEPLPRKGRINRFPLPKVLHAIFKDCLTGRLRAFHDAVEKRVYFKNGYPIYAESSLPEETLGAYLVSTGNISQVQHETALQHLSAGDSQYGEVILKLEYVGPHELFGLLEAHLAQKIIGMFSWFDGYFLFEPGDDWKSNIVVARMKPGRIILDGILQKWSDKKIREIRIMRDTNVPFLLKGQPYSVGDLALSTSEARIWQLVKNNLTLSMILEQSNDSAEALRILFFFYIVGVIGFYVSADGSAIKVQGKSAKDSTHHIAKATQIDQDEETRRVMADYMKYRSVDYFELLGVRRDASIEEVNSAFQKRIAHYDPAKVSRKTSGLVYEKIEEMNILVHKAYATLVSNKDRNRYIASLEEHEDSLMLSSRTRTNRHSILNLGTKTKSDSELYYDKGFSFLREGKYIDALDSFEQAYKLFQKIKYQSYIFWTKYLLGQLSFEDTDKELKILFRGIQDEPLIPFLQGCLCLKEKKTKEAMMYFERVLTIDPQHIDALRQLRLIRMRSNSETPGLLDIFKFKK